MWYGMKKAVTFSYDDGVTQEQSECHIDTILQQVDITRHTGDHRGSSDRIYL